MYALTALYFCLAVAPVLAQDTTIATDLGDPCVALNDPFKLRLISEEDVERIAGCTTIDGNLTIATSTSALLPNLVTILGHILIFPSDGVDGKVWDRQLVETVPVPLTFSFPRLEEIRGYLEIRAETLQTLELPSLSKLDSIKLYAPALQTWTMAQTLQIKTMDLYQHNISQLEFPNLASITRINAIFDNRGSLYLNGTMSNETSGTDVRVGTTNDISFTSDLRNTHNATFSLQGCQKITINAERLANLDIFDSPRLEDLVVPSLIQVGTEDKHGSLTISNNTYLKEIAFPKLQSVQNDLTVTDNERLTTFGGGFSSLEYIGGYLNVYSNITSFDLPKAVTVGEFASIRGSLDKFDCSTIERNFAVGTRYSCTPRNSTVSTSGNDDHDDKDDDEDHKHKETLTYPAKIGLGVGIAVFVVLSIGLGCGFCLWRSHRHPDRSGRATTISSKLLRIWAKESFQKRPPSYPLQDFSARHADEPLPSYQARPSSTATTLAPDVYDVSRPGTGTHPDQHLGVSGRSVASTRPVSPVSAVSMSSPSSVHVPPRPGRDSLPPDYRP
ncbi:hypothetical protein BKA65DRAFT_166089 [Rhexocercosporidium sp. MPI-PUGE-AT-0058]|nr:hypothetical protein BKA65DRAFT_166089 [Rhexocercosporidium sp. MPI-PUGE-AT-0058]